MINKREEINYIKDQGEIKIQKLNDKIQKLHRKLYEKSKTVGRNTIVAKAIPLSSIERVKYQLILILMDLNYLLISLR